MTADQSAATIARLERQLADSDAARFAALKWVDQERKRAQEAEDKLDRTLREPQWMVTADRDRERARADAAEKERDRAIENRDAATREMDRQTDIKIRALDLLAAAEARGGEMERDNKWLRKALAFCYSGTDLYCDDGELQNNRAMPMIDFKRDSVADISRKMGERSAGGRGAAP
jgi:hypothetical protein